MLINGKNKQMSELTEKIANMQQRQQQMNNNKSNKQCTCFNRSWINTITTKFKRCI